MSKKKFFILFAAGILGTLAGLPYVFELQAEQLRQLPVSLAVLAAVSLMQMGVILVITIPVGLLAAAKMGLETPVVDRYSTKENWKHELRKKLPLSIALGIGVALAIAGLDILFGSATADIQAAIPAWWKGLLASLYGGIVEELLMRLFLMSVFAYLLSRILPRTVALWAAIIVASLLFGILHLPATAAITDITGIIIVRALLLNGIGGLAFGWLFWKKGLEAAVIAHMITDIVLHGVLFPVTT